MTQTVKTVHVVEDGNWADALADAIMAASKDGGDTLLDARSFCEKYDFIGAVALLVDTDDPDDTLEWCVALFSEPPSVGDEV
jgi:hypothetical protein